jgi:hypothetical protein
VGMTKAWGPVRRVGTDDARPADEKRTPSHEEIVVPELNILQNWLPAANPTDGQPYRESRAQRTAPAKPQGRVYPKAYDSRGSDF